MKEVTDVVDNSFLWSPPIVLASVDVDPTRHAHLLIYEKYCQVVVGHLTSLSLDKTDAKTVLNELKNFTYINGTAKSKLSSIKYTPSSIRLGRCVLLGKKGYDGLIRALELYINDGPYPKYKPYVDKHDAGKELISKERVGSVSLFSWWDFKWYSFGSSFKLTIVGPYETFSFGFVDKSLIARLSEAVKCLIETDTREIKIDTKSEYPDELNLRVFKQSVCGEPAVCISTDTIMGNQRSLIFIGKESGTRFIEFLKKAKQQIGK